MLAYSRHFPHNLNTNCYHLQSNWQMHNDPTHHRKQAPAHSISAPSAADAAVLTGRLKSHDLFAHAREVEIEHAGRVYTLRLTQQNKLILTA